MKLNEVVGSLVLDNGQQLGIDLSQRQTLGGMSDFGNVSHRVPAAHFSTATWPEGVTAHTPEAVAASCQPQAFEAALAAAKIEAMTAIDLLTRPELAARAIVEFGENDLGGIVEDPSLV
jgi:metal-dependent amidase/aminoacylase/carboxypeptidase family protein